MLGSTELEQADLRALRIVGTGAARTTAAMIAQMRHRFGVPVVVRYTSTEASLGTGTTLESTDDEVATTVGRPVPGVELAIVDDEGRAVPEGEVGRVLLRSDAVMRGYWGRGPGRGRSASELIDAEATEAVLAADGWLTTGDFGRRTEGGNLQLAGRAHERYIRGGYNIYPAEVEQVLATHPSVARVAVTGVADDVLGEVGVAVVVAQAGTQPDLAELRAHCARSLSDYKAPDALVVADELPLTPMMKVDPVRLADLAERGAQERRERLARNRGPGSQVVGSDPTRAPDQKERA
jgi:acyl-CoA synthetase (AMP-forming)/AMP-acid ligase II